MSGVIFRLHGDQELTEFLRGLPASVQSAIRVKIQAQASEFSRYVKDEKLSGQVLNVKTGALRAGVYARTYYAGSRTTLSVGVRGVAYARIQEMGGNTSPHDILPDKASVLAWLQEGRTRFARLVHHPGSLMPERSYLRSALREKQGELTLGLTDSVREVVRAAGYQS